VLRRGGTQNGRILSLSMVAAAVCSVNGCGGGEVAHGGFHPEEGRFFRGVNSDHLWNNIAD
jgi:hypothetical protein